MKRTRKPMTKPMPKPGSKRPKGCKCSMPAKCMKAGKCMAKKRG